MKSTYFLTVPVAVAAQSLTGQYQSATVGNYIINNDNWGTSGPFSTLNINGQSGDGVSWDVSWNWPSTSGVQAYPNSGLVVTKGQLISNINSMPTSADWSYDGSINVGDVAYDLFTAADPNHDPSSGDFELMIW